MDGPFLDLKIKESSGIPCSGVTVGTTIEPEGGVRSHEKLYELWWLMTKEGLFLFSHLFTLIYSFFFFLLHFFFLLEEIYFSLYLLT